MNTKETDKERYDEIFKKIMSGGAPAGRTKLAADVQMRTKESVDEFIKREVVSFACYFSVNALSIYAQKMMRSLVRAVRVSEDNANRRKHHYMQDYLNRGKRVKLLCGKISDLLAKYERVSLEIMDRADRLNTSEQYDNYLFDEALEQESDRKFGPYMDEICQSVCELATARLSPLDSIMFSECVKTLAACMIYQRIYESTIKCVEKDTQRTLRMVYDACDCVIEMLDDMRIEDRKLRHYRWLCSPSSRVEWVKSAMAGKRHIHGVKVTTLHPVNFIEMIEHGYTGKLEYHLVNEMFSVATIDSMISNTTGTKSDFLSRIGDYRIIHCLQNYHQYRISLSAMHGAYVDTLRMLDELPQDEREEFVAAYRINERNVFDFLGCWVKHEWAHDDMGTDAADVKEISSLNSKFAHGATADIYADQNRIAYVGYEAFRNDLQSVLNLSRRNAEILSYKIEPISA